MEVSAYAKINLTLEVLGRRPDGYHEVRTVLQTIDLADTLHLIPSDGIQLQCSDPELEGPDNLVWKAAEAIVPETTPEPGAAIRLEKHIPAGMGLGGGSADAAATLLALNEMWGLHLSRTRLSTIASSLGSDVTFFLRGGTALGTGRGDIVEEMPPLPRSWLVVACPSGTLAGDGTHPAQKTARLYSMITDADYTDGSRASVFSEALRGGRAPDGLLYNAFERVAIDAFPGLEKAWSELDAAAAQYSSEGGARKAHLSGAGPAIYTFVPGKPEGEAIVGALKSRGLEAYLVGTINPSLDLGRGLGP